MPIKFVLLVNKQGQTRLAKYADQAMTVEEKRALEGEIVRKCLTRAEKQVVDTTYLLRCHVLLMRNAFTFGDLHCSAHLWSTGSIK